jgi:CheY-like chemotaxis protein/HPt (histidine-containing phosphotransfer) domain-containing protein
MPTDSLHPDTDRVRKEEATGLSTSRADFVTTLPRRIETVLSAIELLVSNLDAAGPRDNLLRRIHALSASAKVLGFAAAADVLSRVEQRIRTSQPDTLADDLKLSQKNLSDLPALVHRGSYSIAPPHGAVQPSIPASVEPLKSEPQRLSPSSLPQPPVVSTSNRAEFHRGPEATRSVTEPFCVLLFGSVALEQSLLSSASVHSGLEITSTTRTEDITKLAAAVGPDVLLLDATHGSIALLVEELTQSPETAGIPIVALNVPSEATPGLLEQGVFTTLSSRATDLQILVALQQARRPVENRTPHLPPLGEVTLKDLANRLAQELHLGLVDTAPANAQVERIPLGDGTQVRAAIWAALAQIRNHIEEQSEGKIRFERGPDGSIPLAPGPATTSRRNPSNFGTVDLTGRRILVADDDPAVAWLVSGTLRAAGALVTETHDGQRALDLSYRLWPELVVSDILMPGLDGFALCHALKRDVLLRDTPVVLLSWKEDLLFRLRDLGTDADGYLRKEATASSIVQRVQELLRPRHALERRLSLTLSENPKNEVRGRLDETSVRLLLEIATNLERPLRIVLRDATALYDLRVREGALKTATRTRNDGTIEQGHSVLGALIGITAGRFSITLDDQSFDAQFDCPLNELLRPVALHARAAQRVLSGLSLGLVEQLVLDRDAIADELSLLPLSLRPIADELLRGASPRQLLASGATSIFLLESLLSDIARRGAVRAITSTTGEDLLDQEILAMTSTLQAIPSKPAPAPTPLFTFQLTPAPTVTLSRSVPPSPSEPVAEKAAPKQGDEVPSILQKTANETEANTVTATWAEPSGTLAGVGQSATPTAAPVLPAFPASHPPLSNDIDWAMELSWDTTPLTPPPSVPPTSKAPLSSIGFMRPTLSTLPRQKHDETPDLANAVVKAVSEATPAPQSTPNHGVESAQRILPSASLEATNASSKEGISPLSQPISLEPTALKSDYPVPSLPTPNSPNPVAPSFVTTQSTSLEPKLAGFEEEHPTTVSRSDTSNAPVQPATSVVTTENVFTISAPSVEKTTVETTPIRLAQAEDAVPQFTPKPEALSPSPLVCPPPLAGIGTIPLGTTRTPTFGGTRNVTPKPAPSTTSPSPPSTLDAPKLELVVEKEPFAELTPLQPSTTHATPHLPAVQKPPRPADPRLPTHRDHDSDPVFPLVSAAPQVIDVQPALEVGATTNDVLSPVIGSEPPVVVPNRDTLRSPGGSTPPFIEPIAPPSSAELPSPSSDRAVVTATPPTHSPSETTDEHANLSTKIEAFPGKEPSQQISATDATAHEPSPPVVTPSEPPNRKEPVEPKTIERSSSPPPSPASHTVSWLQAIGLSLLAGGITFALTVPIARWVRDRRETKETQVTQVIEPSATTTVAPSPLSASVPIASNASPTMTQPSATLEEIPTPTDVTLAAGQSLIEIVTAAGHAIFVDDSFVGRGPIRVVTVAPGRHIVRTRLNGVERSDVIEIGAGRSMRLSLEQAWK